MAEEGRRRLMLLLGVLNFAGCAVLMALVLYFYGRPYNPIWWLVMAVILVGSVATARALVSAIEWVIKGYQQDRTINEGSSADG